MGASPDYCRRVATYTVTGVNQGAKTFTINEDVIQKISNESITSLSISGSTGNDAVYAIASTSGTTVFTVDESIPDATVDGQVELWNDLDSQTGKLPIVTAENQPLMGGGGTGDDTGVTNYKIYIGSATAWVGFGLCLNTFGSYGTFVWEYYNDIDSDWREFTLPYDSTKDFSKHGVVVWGNLEDWVLFTVNTQSAFWVRVSAPTMTTRALFYNLLRNITLYEPFKLETRTLTGGLHDDINGDIQKTDITDFDERGFLTLSDMGVMTAAVDQQEATNQLKSWQRKRDRLWIIDLARTDPVDFSIDAFIRNYIGYLETINGTIESPHKEAFPYSLTFKFESIIKSIDSITTSTFEDVGEGVFEWVRDTVGTDASDGGDPTHVPT